MSINSCANLMNKVLLILMIIVSAGCSQQNTSKVNLAAYSAMGDSLIAKTFDTLRNSLLREAGQKGFDGAVAYCNTNALGLTNTYADNKVHISRTSNKVRNGNNAPDTMEQKILSKYLTLIEGKQKPTPVIEQDASGNIHYFKPIMLQSMCLNCHGTKEQIQPKTWEMIQSKYPSDLAYGYKEGDFRGIWHVEFNRP